ncbi:MAG: carboxypeptidase-like regulatory domain-containing protein [Acidobacteriota bacterium]|nr:carboxypeptidase-like regulatory domain-containing protein [Acidobacteriota bacterium]
MNNHSENAERGTRIDERKDNFFSFRIPHSAFIISLLLLFFTTGAGLAQQSQTVDASASTSEAGAITGHVTSDDGRPVPGAAVRVIRAYAPVPNGGTAVSTDEEGNFSATGLASGLYNVIAYAPGYVNAPAAAITPGEIGLYRPGDAVNIRLVKGGVITGSVRDANNEPVIAVVMRAFRVKDENGRPTSALSNYFQFRITDDRGVYRIYGLSPGTYIVSAGGSLGFYIGLNGYDTDAPTYYPSSTRDTAAEVPVRAGDEATGIDIRYRGDHGHAISGTINAPSSEQGLIYAINLTLRRASNGAVESNSFITPGSKPTFAIQGISDGTYDLTAQQVSVSSGSTSVSAPRRITVKGMDVTGVELTLTPLGSIAGRATLDPAPDKEECRDKRPATLVETLINARRTEKVEADAQPLMPFTQGGGSVPNEQGEFKIRNLNAGTYRLMSRLPLDRWYIRSVLLRSAPTAPRTTISTAPSKSPTAPSLITLRAGENFAGATVAIAQDGATLRGRIETAKDGAEAPPLPADLKVFLVPAEKERVDDVLRYAEVKPAADGKFTAKNLAPGRYLVIARPVTEESSPERVYPPLVWDSDFRAKLRHDAEAANASVELQPCQRAVDYVLKYPGTK